MNSRAVWTKLMIEAHELSKEYTIDERPVRVVDSVTLEIPAGQFAAIVGSSGSGKSTLLSLLSGLDNPSSGRVILNGEEITAKAEDELAPIRNRTIGFVFQSFHLVPSLTALENVVFPAELARDRIAIERGRELIERVGLGKRMSNFPSQLSGGEKQRVAICRAMVNRPQVLFADEPTGNLDTRNGEAILDLLLELHDEHDTTLVLVTHSSDIARRAARQITLEDGRVVEDRKSTALADGPAT